MLVTWKFPASKFSPSTATPAPGASIVKVVVLFVSRYSRAGTICRPEELAPAFHGRLSLARGERLPVPFGDQFQEAACFAVSAEIIGEEGAWPDGRALKNLEICPPHWRQSRWRSCSPFAEVKAQI